MEPNSGQNAHAHQWWDSLTDEQKREVMNSGGQPYRLTPLEEKHEVVNYLAEAELRFRGKTVKGEVVEFVWGIVPESLKVSQWVLIPTYPDGKSVPYHTLGKELFEQLPKYGSVEGILKQVEVKKDVEDPLPGSGGGEPSPTT